MAPTKFHKTLIFESYFYSDNCVPNSTTFKMENCKLFIFVTQFVNVKPVKPAVFACEKVSPLTQTVQFNAIVSVQVLTSN